jgi:hypothetical protein
VPRALPPATQTLQDQATPPPVAPAAPSPLIAREPPGAVVAPESAPPPAGVRSAEDSIRALLGAYEAAYDGRDVAALRRIVPTLSAEQLDAVGRTFSGAASYDLTLQVLAMNVTGATAIARCLVTHAFVPRVGSPPRSGPVETRFHLRQAGSDWVIERIETAARR